MSNTLKDMNSRGGSYDNDTNCDRTRECTECSCSFNTHVTNPNDTCRTSNDGSSSKKCRSSFPRPDGLVTFMFWATVIFVCTFEVIDCAPQGSYQGEMDWYRERETQMVVSYLLSNILANKLYVALILYTNNINTHVRTVTFWLGLVLVYIL